MAHPRRALVCAVLPPELPPGGAAEVEAAPPRGELVAHVEDRQPIRASDVGRAIRIVGYGQTSGSNKSIGRRNAGTTKIADYDAASFAVAGLPNICLFDSGGPTFMNQNGVDVVVGIHIVVDSAACDSNGYDERVDRYTEFVDGHIRAADPPVDAGTPESDSGSPHPPTPAAETSAGCAIAGSRPSSAFFAPSLVFFAWVLRRLRRTYRRRHPGQGR